MCDRERVVPVENLLPRRSSARGAYYLCGVRREGPTIYVGLTRGAYYREGVWREGPTIYVELGARGLLSMWRW